MRMRFKPYAHDELMAADFHVHEPLIWGGKWHAQYARPEQPFVLELGCGKGGFISQLACAHPENNYLGIDITATRGARTLPPTSTGSPIPASSSSTANS